MNNLDYQSILIENKDDYLKVLPFVKEDGYSNWRGETPLEDPPDEFPCTLTAIDLNVNVLFGLPDRRLIYSSVVTGKNVITIAQYIELIKSYRKVEEVCS